MRYWTLLFSLLFYISSASAQEYSSIPQGKTYYTNGLHYLKGMRIDSTAQLGDSICYYPFRTARTVYNGWDTMADMQGGSWWGKTITDYQGYTFTGNYRGELISIKRNAVVGETWSFFQDSSAIHYEATVIGMDTLSVAGETDSVKIIELRAIDAAGNTAVADSVNGLLLKLSQHHGWVAAIDFYLFPYRQPDGMYDASFDCYFYEFTDGGFRLNSNNLIFNRVDYKIPYGYAIYDFQPGDTLKYSGGRDFSFNSYIIERKDVFVTSRTETDSSIYYTYTFNVWNTYYPGNAGPQTSYGTNTGSWNIRNNLLADTATMPEEMSNDAYYQYYFPEDTSFCYTSARYLFRKDKIIGGRFGGGGPEPSYPEMAYKEGLGEILYESGGSVVNGTTERRGLGIAQKGAFRCHADNTLGIAASLDNGTSQLKVYPVPASVMLWIETVDQPLLYADLMDITGKKQASSILRGKNKEMLDVSALPDGIYFLRIVTKDNIRSRKIIIRHF